MPTMKLETHRGVLAEREVLVCHLMDAVAQMTDRDVEVEDGTGQKLQPYVILSTADEQYVQAVGSPSVGGYLVERRDGCAGEHYRGDVRVSGAVLLTLLTGYLLGQSNWSHPIEWHRVDVNLDHDQPSA